MKTITEKLNEVSKQVEEIAQKRADLLQKVQRLTNEVIQQFFVDNPNIDRVEMYVNNHEFNDGEPTYFAVSYEDPLFYLDGNEEPEDEETEELEAIKKPLVELFEMTQDFHEEMYADQESPLTFERK